MKLHDSAKRLQKHEVTGNETTNAEYTTHNGDFGVYFRNKQIKLDTQAKEEINKVSEIFNGCMIYITGYTVPSAIQLKRLIVENGGQICAFLGGKSYVTHIIASSLTSRKIELFSNLKVVKPAWVVDSVDSRKLLDWTKYRTVPVLGNSTFSNPPIDEASSEGHFGYDVNDAELNGDIAADSRTSALVDVAGPEGDKARIKWIEETRKRVNCLEPNFISDYFSKSRLHFLTTRKMELRRRCRAYESSMLTRPNPPLVRRTIMHVDFDSFFVAATLTKFTNIRDKPVCVSHGSPGSDIASCNYVARESGVSNGMWVSNAKEHCPNLICLPYDFELYTEFSDRLYDTLLGLEPLHISAISVDEAILDITNLIESGKSCEEIGTSVRERVHELTGIHVSVGVGSNILLAKLALKLAKPAGFRSILDASEIKNMKIHDLPGVGRRISSQLNEQLKIGTVEELQRIPLSELQSILGNYMGQKLYGYARGMDSSDITAIDVPIKSVGVDVGWGVRVINESEKIQFTMNCARELWERIMTSGTEMELLTVKLHVRSPNSPFISSKYLGHGISDTKSRSKRVLPRLSLEELQRVVVSLVQSLECPPLDFRGLGLHMKVSEPGIHATGPKQYLLTDSKMVNNGDRTPSTSKREMVSLVPRKKRKGATLTQWIPNTTKSRYEDIDMDVLAELPSQIRREVLLNEDDYNVPEIVTVPLGPPLFKHSEFLDVHSHAQLREIIINWVRESKAPVAEDAQSFWEYICDAAKEDSSWVHILDICEWFMYAVEQYASHHDWFELLAMINTKTQELIKQRV